MSTRNERVQRLLHFMKNCKKYNLKKELIYNATRYHITDDIYIERPAYDMQSFILFHVCDTEYGTRKCQVLKAFPDDYHFMDGDSLVESFFNDNYYSQFVLFNPESTNCDFTTSAFNCGIVDIPDYDVQTEEGKFQFSLLYADEVCDIMETIQYFRGIGHNAYCDWYHYDFDKVYEVLDGLFGIGGKDYLLGTSV